MKRSLRLIHTQHGDCRLRNSDNDDFATCEDPGRLTDTHPLTVAPCIITLIWHHLFKGTWKVEVNADSPDFPFIWTCS